MCEANIEFITVNILKRSEQVPADENGVWVHFVNRLTPEVREICASLVYDLLCQDGHSQSRSKKRIPSVGKTNLRRAKLKLCQI